MIQPKTAFITGASSGIGLELARIFAREHYDLILVARSSEKLEEIAKSLHNEFLIKATPMCCDLSRSDDIDRLIARIESENRLVDVLVNNAGFGEYGPFSDTDWGREHQMIELNVSALVRLTKYFLPKMLNRRSGRILQIASTAAFQPGPFMAVYFATKAFVLSFTEAVAVEIAGTGVSITAVCPGPTQTGFGEAPGMAGTLMFEKKGLPTGREVAEFSYRSMMKRKKVAIHGWMNRFLNFLIPVTPRFIVIWIAKKIIQGA